MDNLRFNDFLVVGRRILCIGWCALAIPAAGLHAEEPAGSKGQTERTDQADEGRSAATAETQKIQRLLKLLSSRYPDRYGTVDPGRLDGVSGEDTKIAIRNFRSIAHLPGDATPNSRLTAEILSELASMSASVGTESQAKAEVDCAQSPEAAQCNIAKPTVSVAAAPPTASPKKDEASSVPSTVPAAANPVNPKPTPQPVRDEAKSAKPAAPVARAATQVAEVSAQANTKLYFVQAASLRSLDAAKREWAHIKEDNRAALEGEQVYFERAEVKDRGLFYRILIGPEPNRNDANTLCAFLKQNSQSCVVTSRNSADIRRNAERGKVDSQDGAVSSDSKAKGSSLPAAGNTPTDNAIAEPVKPSVAQPPAPPPPAKPAAASADQSPNLATAHPSEPQVPRPVPQSAPPAIPGTPSGQPAVSATAAPATTGASTANAPAPGKTPAAPVAPAVVAANPIPAAPAERNEPRTASPARGDQQSYSRFVDQVIASSQRLADGLPNLTLVAILAAVLMFSAVLYHKRRRIQRATFSTAVAANDFPIAGMKDEQTETGQTIATLEGDFESPQLRDFAPGPG